MSWGGLLESVHGLNRVGMSVSRALEHLARSELDAGRQLAHRWLMRRHRVGDPGLAMRSLGPQVEDPRDRFGLEVLALCLERPEADHHQILGVAVEQLRLERASSSHRRVSRRLALALILAALSAGAGISEATDRAVSVFGREADDLRALLESSHGGAIPTIRTVESALREARAQESRWRGRVSVRALPRVIAVAAGLTLGTLGVVFPSSAEVAFAGW